MDVRQANDAAVATMLRDLEVDIAVDLKRPIPEAHAPESSPTAQAPVQVHYLGYPGTMGADYIDYLIADPTASRRRNRAFLFRTDRLFAGYVSVQ